MHQLWATTGNHPDMGIGYTSARIRLWRVGIQLNILPCTNYDPQLVTTLIWKSDKPMLELDFDV